MRDHPRVASRFVDLPHILGNPSFGEVLRQCLAPTQHVTRQQGSSSMADHTCILISPCEPSLQLEVQTSDAKRESNNLLFEKEELDKQVEKGSK